MDSPTSRPRRLAPAASLTMAGLVAAAAAIVIQIASGAEYPTIPPGLLILLAAGGPVAPATRWRWTTIVGVIVPLLLLLVGAARSHPKRESSCAIRRRSASLSAR